MSKSWSSTTRYLALILVLVAIIWLVTAGSALVAPLAVSALLAFVLNPLVHFVNQRSKLSRTWVVPLVYLISMLLIGILVALLIPILPPQITNLSGELQTILTQIEAQLATPIMILGREIPLDLLLQQLPSTTADFISPDLFLNLIRSTSANIVWVLVVLVTTYYLLLDWARLRDWMMTIVPPDHQSDARRLYAQLRDVWQRYLQGQLRLMVIIGILTGLMGAAIGLQGAWAFGLFAGLFDVVLSVGPLIVMAIAMLVAYITGSAFLPISNFWFMLLVLLLFGAIQAIENVWLRPRVLGGSLRLHPAIVFVGIVASLSLAGVLLALIIVPLMSSFLVVGRYLYCKILDINPWPEGTNMAKE